MELLKWKHVNFKAEEVTITTYKDKNMKQWEISVSTRLKAELLKLKLQRKSDDADERLFASASVNLRKVWEAARKDAGITSMRFHDLRHTFATRMADASLISRHVQAMRAARRTRRARLFLVKESSR